MGDSREPCGRTQLLAFLEELDLERVDPFSDETSLIRSGLLDSTALFHLVEWIESQVGRPVDPSSVDLLEEWDTVPGVLAFIQKHRDSKESVPDPKDPA